MKKLAEDVWRLASKKPGPHLIVLGGVHGNERTGVEVVRLLKERFDASPKLLKAGTLTIAVGNPKAVARGTRGSDDHLDLNRAFTAATMKDVSTYENRRAAELAWFIDEADLLIDLHGTNKPSEPFVATTDLDTAHHALLAVCFDCDRMLIALPSAITGTTDGWINQYLGKAGILYESGWVGDPMRVNECMDGVRRAMGLYGLTDDPPPSGGLQGMYDTLKKRLMYALRDPVILTPDGFAFESGRGERSWEPVRVGDLIGRTDSGRKITAPYDGVLMFPKVPELWKVGNPVVTFAQRIEIFTDPPP